MLQPKLSLTGKSPLVLTDSTGEYANDNAGGYNGLNPSRNAFHAVLLAALHSFGEDSAIVAEPFPLGVDSQEAGTWRIKPQRDGFYSFLMVLAPQHDYTLLYPAGKIVYDSGELYHSIQNTVAHQEASNFEPLVQGTLLSDAAFWKPITHFADYPLFTANTGAYFGLKEYLHKAFTDAYMPEKAVDFADSLLNGLDSNQELRAYVYRDALNKAADIACHRGNHTFGGLFLDELHHVISSDKGKC